MSEWAILNSVEQVVVFVASVATGSPLTGASDLFVRVCRSSDGFFYDWSDATFKGAGWTTLNQLLTERDATNAAGLYEVTGGFDLSAITNKSADDTYQIIPLQTPGTTAVLPTPGEFKEVSLMGGSVSDIADAVWKEPIADHSGTAGSTAEELAKIG